MTIIPRTIKYPAIKLALNNIKLSDWPREDWVYDPTLNHIHVFKNTPLHTFLVLKLG